MRLFIDTSSLFKRYVEEPGSEAFGKLFSEASQIVVSPTTWIEINVSLERCLRAKIFSSEKIRWLLTEAKKDFAHFLLVSWNEELETKAVEIVREHWLKTMDAIQLASGILSDSDIFVTSDSRLYQAAKKLIRRARFI